MRSWPLGDQPGSETSQASVGLETAAGLPPLAFMMNSRLPQASPDSPANTILVPSGDHLGRTRLE